MFKEAPVKLIRILPAERPMPGRHPFARAIILLKWELKTAAARERIGQVARWPRHLAAWASRGRTILRQIRERIAPRCAVAWAALRCAVGICRVRTAAAARQWTSAVKERFAEMPPKLDRMRSVITEKGRRLARRLMEQAQAIQVSRSDDAQVQDLVREVIALREQVAAQQRELAQIAARVGDLNEMIRSQQGLLVPYGAELDTASIRATPPDSGGTRRPENRAARSAGPRHCVAEPAAAEACAGVSS
jgi:hypothetical protein